MKEIRISYSVEYFSESTGLISEYDRKNYNPSWFAAQTSPKYWLELRALAHKEYIMFVNFKRIGEHKEMYENIFPRPYDLNASVLFSWWDFYDQEGTKKSIELTNTLQNEYSQLESLKSEFELYKMFFSEFKGELILEYEEAKIKGPLAVVNRTAFLENNRLLKALEYQIDLEIINEKGNVLYKLSKCFNNHSSFTNRIQALFFLGGVYASLNTYSTLYKEAREPLKDEIIIFKDEKCKIHRKLTITKYNVSNSPTVIVINNDFDQGRKIILEALDQEYQLYKMMNISMTSGFGYYDNDFFSFTEYDIILHKKTPSQFHIVKPSELLIHGCLFLDGELYTQLKISDLSD